MNWDEYFINIANQIKLKSKDRSTKIGVVIVGSENQIIATGYNSFPAGIEDNLDERQERPEKYYWFEHAERNAIYNAAKTGVSTLGTKMYMTCDISCADCARGIINSGIKEVIFTPAEKKWPAMYEESAKRSIQMFKEAGIIVRSYS